MCSATSTRRRAGAASASTSSSRASAYAKHPDDKAWLFDPDTMKPRVNNPAFVRAIQDVIDHSPPSRPIRSTPTQRDGLPAVPGRHRLDALMVGRCGSMAGPATAPSSAMSSVSISCPAPTTSTMPRPARGTSCRAVRTSRPTWPISAGVSTSSSRVDSDEKKKKAAWSAAAHLGGKDISLWMAAYPSGYQPYRNSHFDITEWVEAGYDEAYITSYLDSIRTATIIRRGDRAATPASSNTTASPRTSLQDLRRSERRAGGRRRDRAAWEKLTDQIGRDKQIELYKASLGM